MLTELPTTMPPTVQLIMTNNANPYLFSILWSGVIFGIGGPVLASFLISIYSIVLTFGTGNYPAHWLNAAITQIALIPFAYYFGFVPAVIAGLCIGAIRVARPALVLKNRMLWALGCGCIGCLFTILYFLRAGGSVPSAVSLPPPLVRAEFPGAIGGIVAAVLAFLPLRKM